MALGPETARQGVQYGPVDGFEKRENYTKSSELSVFQSAMLHQTQRWIQNEALKQDKAASTFTD